jgi:vault protein inter-alpha-trypsin-like protein
MSVPVSLPPPTLAIGHAEGATVARAALAVRGRHATLTLVLTTAVRDRKEVMLPISIPHGAAVTGMAVIEQDHRTVASAQIAEHAYESYESTVNREIDPVLLNHAGGTRAQEYLQLNVFPLAKATPVTVELSLELPDGPTLVIDPEAGTLARLEIDTGERPTTLHRVHEPQTIALPDGHAEPALSLVDERTSLLAEPRLDAIAPSRIASGPAGLRTAADIRAGMRTGAAALAACAEDDPMPHMLAFVIAADGKVSDVAGADDCVAEEVRRWQFAPAREATLVQLPLSWDAR